jgi:hypothetical protein
MLELSQLVEDESEVVFYADGMSPHFYIVKTLILNQQFIGLEMEAIPLQAHSTDIKRPLVSIGIKKIMFVF